MPPLSGFSILYRLPKHFGPAIWFEEQVLRQPLVVPVEDHLARKGLIVPSIVLMPTKGSRWAGGRWLTDPARRFLNVLVAVVALVTLAPLMLLIAVLVGLSSRGPGPPTRTI